MGCGALEPSTAPSAANRQPTITHTYAARARPLSVVRSFYWRIGVSFLALVVAVIVGQSVMFTFMMRAASTAPPPPHLRAAAIASLASSTEKPASSRCRRTSSRIGCSSSTISARLDG